MDKYGPLYHRNTKLLPAAVSRTVIGVILLIGLTELVLGTIAIVH